MEPTLKPNEVFIEEFIKASPDKVFNAWTDPEKLMNWYAPEGCTFSIKTLNVQTGGQFHTCISNPQFGDCWCIGEYKEVTPYSKLVFTLINADEQGQPINPADIGMDPDWPGATLVTVIFTEENGGTRLQLRQTVSQELAIRTGAHPSWLQMLGKLKNLLNA